MRRSDSAHAVLLGTLLAGTVAFTPLALDGRALSTTRAAADSLRILKRAKAAQARFESRRRFLAPRSYRDMDGPCERIGRFCVRHTGEAMSDIPNEPAAIARERQRLLTDLSAAANALPGDSWLAGQRVRYLIEAGDDSAALTVAARCSSDLWWCDDLRGLALHADGNFPRAEQAFTRSLTEMPRSTRCEWTDLAVLLEDDARDSYGKLDCEAREAANARIWWLSDPLYVTPGNERRTAHFARLTWARIEQDGANGFGMAWGDDMREIIVRYGWAEKWTVIPTTTMIYAEPSYVAHEREPNFHFVPVLSYARPLETFGDTAWNLGDDRPHEAYAPEEITTFERLDPQTARFRRGDSTLIVAAFDVSGDTAWSSPALRSALVIAPDDSTRFSIAILDRSARRDALSILTATRPMLIGVELLSHDHHTAGRWRSAMQPITVSSTAPALSDLLLFDATDSLATGLEGAMATALGSRVVLQDKKTGVYWEMYGASPKDSALSISLSFVPLSPGLLTRAIQALGIGRRREPVNIRWTESAPGGGVGMTAAQSMLFDLSQIPRGRYELRLEIGNSSPAAIARTSRVVEIR